MSLAKLERYFSLQAFIKGMGAVFLIYALLGGYIAFKSDSTMRELSSKLAFEAAPLAEPKLEVVTEENKVMKNGLMLAPIEGLYEASTKTGGMLPKISPRGLTPFHGYKKPFKPSGKPIIALAISNFGLSQNDSQKLLEKMPENVTFILTPYASDVQAWQQKAREGGHETWLYIPAENETATIADPGSQALLSHSNIQYNKDRLDWALSLTTGYAGIAMDMDNTFLEVKPMLTTLMEDNFKRGLGYFEMNAKGPTLIETLAIESKMPYIRSAATLTGNSFDNLEIAAQGRGAVGAVIRPDQIDQEKFIQWVASLESKGFELAPLSALAQGQ